MTTFGGCWSPNIDGAPAADSLKATADVCGRAPVLRLVVDLAKCFPTSTTVDLEVIAELYDRSRSVGWRTFLNAINLPAWATGGKGAYNCNVVASSCGNLFRRLTGTLSEEAARGVIDLVFARVLLQQTTAEKVIAVLSAMDERIGAVVGDLQALQQGRRFAAEEFAAGYEAEETTALCWADPFHPGPFAGNPHVFGAVPELDKYTAPRPWMLSANAMLVQGAVDHAAVQYMGEVIGTRFFGAELYGLLNEPDIAESMPLMRFDGVNRPDDPEAPDVVRDELYPKHLLPFFAGIHAGVERGSLGHQIPMFAGPEVAYPGTLARFLADKRSNVFSFLSHHCYGDGGTIDGSYVHAEQYRKILADDLRLAGCTEFNAPGTQLLEWVAEIAKRRMPWALINFLDMTLFVDGFKSGGKELNLLGRDMKALIAGQQTKRHAVRS